MASSWRRSTPERPMRTATQNRATTASSRRWTRPCNCVAAGISQTESPMLGCSARSSTSVTLELAARENESLVDDALRLLLEEDQAITLAAVKEWVGRRETARPVTDVQVELTNLSSFDELFRHKEVWDCIGVGAETTAGGVPSRAPSAHVS